MGCLLTLVDLLDFYRLLHIKSIKTLGNVHSKLVQPYILSNKIEMYEDLGIYKRATNDLHLHVAKDGNNDSLGEHTFLPINEHCLLENKERAKHT